MPFMLIAQHYFAVWLLRCVFLFSYCSVHMYLCTYASACIGFCPTWHIWMCLAQPKFLNMNPQALHNPSLLCNDCCSSLALFALSSFSCPTPCPVGLPRSQSLFPSSLFLFKMSLTSCSVKLQLAFLTHHNYRKKIIFSPYIFQCWDNF